MNHLINQHPHIATKWQFHLSTFDRAQPPGSRRRIVRQSNGCHLALVREACKRAYNDLTIQRHRDIGYRPLGQPKIHDVRLMLIIHQDVSWFYIAMDDARLVSMVQSSCVSFANANRFERGGMMCGDPFHQRNAAHVVRDNVGSVVFSSYFMDTHDVGMRQLCAARASRKNCSASGLRGPLCEGF